MHTRYVSIRNGLLALLSEEPKYGFQLKKEFEETTAEMWSLNVGQVYTTLSRLVRDGLVSEEGTDDQGQRSYRLTDRGRDELAEWFASPRRAETLERDELTIKVAMALSTPGVDVGALIQTQRREATTALQQLTRRKARLDADDLSQAAVLDAAAGRLDAELRWLDLVEARLDERTKHGRKR
jgi:DNA-binding PadR family transcriptional regulator